MKPKFKVTSMRLDPGAKIGKSPLGNFTQPVLFTVEGHEKEFKYEITARRKKDLPGSIAYMQKRVDGYAGGVEVETEGDRISCVSYMLF